MSILNGKRYFDIVFPGDVVYSLNTVQAEELHKSLTDFLMKDAIEKSKKNHGCAIQVGRPTYVI